MSSKIETELLKATKVRKKSDEKQNDYLKRLVTAVQELDESDWDELKPKTQNWVNAGATAISQGDKIKGFPDAVDDDEAEAPRGKKRDEEDDDEPKSRKKRDPEHDDDDDRPSRSKKRDPEDDDDDEPRSRKKRDPEDDDDEPRRGKKRDEEDDDEPRGKKRDRDEDDDAPRSRRRKDGDEDDGNNADAEDGAEGEDEDGNVTSKKGSGKKKDAAPKKAAKKEDSALSIIKNLIIKNPVMSVDKLVATMENKGFDVARTSLTSMRASTLDTLRRVQKIGLPKGEF